MQLYTVADITGDGAAHQIATSGKAQAIWIGATGGALRVGDASVTAARGVNVAQNTVLLLQPQGSDQTTAYPLNFTYVFVPNGTTASITYAQ